MLFFVTCFYNVWITIVFVIIIIFVKCNVNIMTLLYNIFQNIPFSIRFSGYRSNNIYTKMYRNCLSTLPSDMKYVIILKNIRITIIYCNKNEKLHRINIYTIIQVRERMFYYEKNDRYSKV